MPHLVELLVTKIAAYGELPFDLPNEETIAAMRELNQNQGNKFSNSEELFNYLEI